MNTLLLAALCGLIVVAIRQEQLGVQQMNRDQQMNQHLDSIKASAEATASAIANIAADAKRTSELAQETLDILQTQSVSQETLDKAGELNTLTADLALVAQELADSVPDPEPVETEPTL